jgi:hypothetical protein
MVALLGRGVRVPSRMTGRELVQLRRSNRPEITATVLLYDLYVSLVEQGSENLLRNMLRRKLLAPEDHDDLFEVWALLKLVDAHLREGWELAEARLIGSDDSPKRPRFSMTNGTATAEIFYQTIPSEMAKASVYKDIFDDYDLGVSLRRPDITVRVSSPLGVQRVIVEVKRTIDAGYISESVYKALGYISDFRDTIGPNAPVLLLLVWDGISPKRQPPPDRPIHILTAAQFEKLALPY